MPELPEVETVRLALVDHVIGRRIRRVEVRRRQVIDGPSRPADLLRGQTITAIIRHGKQLALVGEAPADGDHAAPCLCVHLGMTGSLRYSRRPAPLDKHQHVLWRLDDGGCLIFRDPRRFGGVWPFPTWQELLQRRWARLGLDALTIQPRALHERLQSTARGIKAALLDQTLIAGLGNIYVDELLFLCRISPLRPARAISRPQIGLLVRNMRQLLARAIKARGSTVRNYVDAHGRQGRYQFAHKVYGRLGQQCLICDGFLSTRRIAGRTTVFCPACQR